MLTWSTISVVGSAFTASLVEVVEAFTILLVVATIRGWRPAVIGAGAALLVLGLVVVGLGPMLDRVPLYLLQFVIGVLLLLFGINWLRKAALRAAGALPMHDEAAVFAEESERLTVAGRVRRTSLDWLAGVTAFKAVLLEGIEVVFIVLAVGAGRGLLLPASVGAVAACIVGLLAGMLARRPLTRVPENALKFGVGVMLSAFGVFWTGEGLGVAWPGGDLALLAFAALFLLAGLAAARLARPERLGATP